MNQEEIIQFLKNNLKIKVYPERYGGWVGEKWQEERYGIKIELLLKNPLTEQLEQIDCDKTDLIIA